MPSIPQKNNENRNSYLNSSITGKNPSRYQSGLDIIDLQKNKKGLDEAFQQFTRLSDEILKSYNHLEQKVEALNDELELVSKQRLEEYEQKEILAQRLQGLLSILPSAVIQVDGRGFISEFNPVAESLLKVSLQGKKWIEVVQQCFDLSHSDGVESLLKDGSRVHVATCPMSQEKGQLIVITDITDLYQLKVRADRNKRLTSIGRSMASLSHQLRTPLSTALLYVSHLQNNHLPQAQKNEMARKLQGRLENMNQQIDDMLLFARGGLEMAVNFNLFKWFSDIRLTLEEIFFQYQVQPQFDININKQCCLYINKNALRESILSLVTNACQAVEKEQNPIVVIKVSTSKGQLQFVISDNGCGVSETVSQDLFDPFITSKSKGTGLGLAIVHTVINSSRGKVYWRNKSEGGAEFSFTLPLVQELHKEMRNPMDLTDNTDSNPLMQQAVAEKKQTGTKVGKQPGHSESIKGPDV